MRDVGRDQGLPLPEDKERSALPRRHFLGASAALLGLHPLSEADASTNPPTPEAAPVRGALDKLRVADFEPLVGEIFRARAMDGSTLRMELIEAKASEPRPGLSDLGIREDPFHLSFRAPLGAIVSQGIFTMDHHRVGTLDLFLCPVGFRRPSDPVVLHAVFG